MKIHKSVTIERVMEAIEMDEMTGFCVYCGEEAADSVEPDGRSYPCEVCERPGVYGTEELLLMMA